MGIVTREWEGMGMGKCGKIPIPPHSTDTEEQRPSLKNTRIENFEELCNPDEDINPVRNELAEYVNLKVAKNIDMMQFWSDHRTLPKLYAIAPTVLCISATSSPSERVSERHEGSVRRDALLCLHNP